MDELQIGSQIVRYDRDMTIRTYASLERGDTDRCGCSYCRNFAAQRPAIYPPSFLTLLDRLGVDPTKEGEVYEMGPSGDRRLYGGWLFFTGQLVRAGDRVRASDNPDFEYCFDDAYRPPPEAEFGDHFLVVQFSTSIPWLLDEES